ncbi:hypothetical protein GCM10007857_03390 [Bradyrhizobium iriomotense]|uniref:Thioesterase domain-containing protein n=2 Tax=Bradyrhizobium iriomotense TaxID=441950 RepID=A0ABQ6ART7_9BRAD|nr:hypothetical protein GCM10007857_03390 [Bradyrhizobium iriomotense]
MSIEAVDYDLGRAVFEGRPDKRFYNPFGSVQGGYAATLLDAACGGAVHTHLAIGQAYATLELKVSYQRRLVEASSPIRAEGRVLSVGRRIAFSEARLIDAQGQLCATASATIMVFHVPDNPPANIEATKEGSRHEV